MSLNIASDMSPINYKGYVTKKEEDPKWVDKWCSYNSFFWLKKGKDNAAFILQIKTAVMNRNKIYFNVYKSELV